jgi:hypothetical protein
MSDGPTNLRMMPPHDIRDMLPRTGGEIVDGGLARDHKHWRVKSYDSYLRSIDERLADPTQDKRREYWLTLRHGWVELKRAFEAELSAREAAENSDRVRDLTKKLFG